MTIHPQDPVWMVIAFICGLIATWIKQPPLVGFLAAGFLLNAFGVGVSDFLHITADLGITLLLFTLGLKLNIRSFLSVPLWSATSIHLTLTTLMIAVFVFLLTSFFGFMNQVDLKTSLLIGFALTFSSTVFAVKILDQMGASSTEHGTWSVSVLIVQDIAAVLFIAASAGKWPSPWAIGLVLILPFRHVLNYVLNKSGHGELLLLLGITLAVSGAYLFEMVDMKGDLGALVVGMLLAGHPKSNELAKGLLGFKNLFLVGFFLTIGMTALPSWRELIVALCILAFLPFKIAFYFHLFNRFKVGFRTSWQSSLNLANFSEFGLIVGAISVAKGWLPPSWLAVFAILMALSFVISAPIAMKGDEFYAHWAHKFNPEDREIGSRPEADRKPLNADILVFGMGRVGTAIFDKLVEELPGRVLGIDTDEDKVHKHQKAGRKVSLGDGTDPDFWIQSPNQMDRIKWVILALPSHEANCSAAQRFRERQFQGRIAATTRFPDQVSALKEHGAEIVFNIYSEAGRGFAADFLGRVKSEPG